MGYGAAPRGAGRPQRRARSGARPPAGPDTAVLEAAPHESSTARARRAGRERPRSTPPVRKLAKELGVDLALVEASGATGLITRADVETYAARVGVAGEGGSPHRAAAPQKPRPDAGERTTRIPIRGVRKHTADAMVRSAFTAPHVTTFHTVDVTATSELIASLRADRSLQGHRIGVMAVAAKAVCLALMAHPTLNSKWDADAAEIVHHHYVNLGIAAATERGLVVPNIRDAETMTLVELADAIGAARGDGARGKTAPCDMMRRHVLDHERRSVRRRCRNPDPQPRRGRHPRPRRRAGQPWEHQGEIALRHVMTLSLSFDHRLVDGEQGARFLARSRTSCASPAGLCSCAEAQARLSRCRTGTLGAALRVRAGRWSLGLVCCRGGWSTSSAGEQLGGAR